MTPIKWTDSYSVGVKEIDHQHQKMFDIINKLYDLSDKPKSKEDFDAVVKELVDYANYHFSTEEKYFDKFNYAEKEGHEHIHMQYSVKIVEFQTRVSDNLGPLLSEMLDFLQDWWVGHINGTDKRYTESFHQHDLY